VHRRGRLITKDATEVSRGVTGTGSS